MFPDQGKKLAYLLRRGDRRPREPGDPRYVLIHPTAGAEPTRERAAHNQASLSATLGEDPARVNNWFNERSGIPDHQVSVLCRIYGVDELAFRTLPFEQFKIVCENPAPRVTPSLSLTWRRVLAHPDVGSLALATTDPHLPRPTRPPLPARLRYASSRVRREGTPVPDILQGQAFWMRLETPLNVNRTGKWWGWRLLLFSRDCRIDGYHCLVPANADPEDFGPDVFPPVRQPWWLPRMPILRHDPPDEGVFELVAILSRSPAPVELVADLAGDHANGPAIEGVLDRLGVWLEDQFAGGSAGLATARYRITVAKPSDQ